MTDKTKEYRRNWNIKRYNDLKKQGLCPRCGKNKPKENKVYCQDCIDKTYSYYHKK